MNKVDTHLKYEYETVMNSGNFNIILFDCVKWFSEDELVLTGIPSRKVNAVYRGYMMPSEKYERFYNELQRKNIRLITEPEPYARFHTYPRIYTDVRNDALPIIPYPKDVDIDFNEVLEMFPRFVIKDYNRNNVVSKRFPKFFSKDMNETEFMKWLGVFYLWRGGYYCGSAYVQEYIDLKTYDGHTNFYKVLYANNKIAAVSAVTSQPQCATEPEWGLVRKYKNLESPLYSIEYAELEDGRFIITDVDDGQVSGILNSRENKKFYSNIFKYFL